MKQSIAGKCPILIGGDTVYDLVVGKGCSVEAGR